MVLLPDSPAPKNRSLISRLILSLSVASALSIAALETAGVNKLRSRRREPRLTCELMRPDPREPKRRTPSFPRTLPSQRARRGCTGGKKVRRKHSTGARGVRGPLLVATRSVRWPELPTYGRHALSVLFSLDERTDGCLRGPRSHATREPLFFNHSRLSSAGNVDVSRPSCRASRVSSCHSRVGLKGSHSSSSDSEKGVKGR